MTSTGESNLAPQVVIDALNSLLDAEANGVIHFMADSTPYVSRTSAELRKPLQNMIATSERHSNELAELIVALNGSPLPPTVRLREQYLAYLSIQFLLPKLIEEKQAMIQRYEAVMAALPSPPGEVAALLQDHVATHRRQLESLQRSSSP